MWFSSGCIWTESIQCFWPVDGFYVSQPWKGLIAPYLKRICFRQGRKIVVQTGSTLVSCHLNVARSCQPPQNRQEILTQNMFLWGPPSVGPKNVRFWHSFQKNFDKNLISRFCVFLVRFSSRCKRTESIQCFWPVDGFYVSQPWKGLIAILEKDFFRQGRKIVVQTGSMLVSCHLNVARSCQPPQNRQEIFTQNMFLWGPPFVGPKNVRFW